MILTWRNSHYKFTTQFSKEIKTKLELDKCRKLNIKEGTEVVTEGKYNIDEEQQITVMNDEELYKYLGYNQDLDQQNFKSH